MYFLISTFHPLFHVKLGKFPKNKRVCKNAFRASARFSRSQHSQKHVQQDYLGGAYTQQFASGYKKEPARHDVTPPPHQDIGPNKLAWQRCSQAHSLPIPLKITAERRRYIAILPATNSHVMPTPFIKYSSPSSLRCRQQQERGHTHSNPISWKRASSLSPNPSSQRVRGTLADVFCDLRRVRRS